MASQDDTAKKKVVVKRGTCRVCGCTDKRACPGGCAWADDSHTICTECVTEPAMVTGESISLEEWAERVAEDLVASGDALCGPVVDGKKTYRLTAQGERRRDANHKARRRRDANHKARR